MMQPAAGTGERSIPATRTTRSSAKSKFGGRDLCYKVPDGLAYPTVAAFRALVDYDAPTGKYCWKHGKDPIAVWDACKGELTTKIMNFASAIGDNPNAVGKDANIWDLAYMTVERCVEE